jgi:hypothetical protein
MGWGIFKPVDDDDPGPAADEANLSKAVGKISKLSGIKDEKTRHETARGLLADVDKIVERGKARQARQQERRDQGKKK